jgi:amino acid adenylation domain-containing protein
MPTLIAHSQLPPEQQAIRDKCFHPSGTFVEFPSEDIESSVCARFEKIAAQYPDNWAIVSDAESLTYVELNDRANGVARSILERTSAGSEPIGLLFDTKLALIVAMLGVLKAGKVIVLLDAAAPSARLINILNDTRSRVLLTELALRARGLELRPQQVEVLDISTYANDCGGNLRLPIEPETPLAISYTGGTTGAPKGVILTHRNVLHLAMIFANSFHYCDQDRISYFASASTNAAVNHPFLALLAGAAVLPFDVKRHGVERLALWLKQKDISICSLSAPLFRVFANSERARLDLPNLRVLRLSSEASYKADFALYRERFPRSCLLANGIAPSEAYLLSLYLMDHDSVIDTDEIPIGYPLQEKEISLIDDAGREVGFDRIGEIVVRSAYLSPGYWNRPELTAAKFRASECVGPDRLYYTGDLGLRRADGCLIHKGRKDFLFKVRGYAVEPAEVEAVMRRHPSVREACVIGSMDEVSGVARLNGYYTEQPGACLTTSELRSFLESRLLDYMIPSVLVPMAQLPLALSGKIDRAALPVPSVVRPELSVPYAAPSNECEARLAAIWSEVLGLEDVGTDDNFFDLGGDSLSAMRILARVRNGLHAEVSFNEFYEAPTIAALALLVRLYPEAKLEQEARKLEPRERVHPISLSLAQERLWFLEQLEPQAGRYNLVAAFGLEGSLNVAALEAAINEIVRRHEVLRTVFGHADGKPFQVVLDDFSITVPVLDAEPMPGETVEQAVQRMCAAEARQPFSLERGPLLRANIIRTRAKAHVLVLTLHHLVYDAWSFKVFANELSSLYASALTNQSSRLAPLVVQYADFALWQREWLHGRNLDAHLAYWRNRLAEVPELQLPTDRPRPPVRESRATRRWFRVSPEVARALHNTTREAGTTLFMTLLAAYQTLLFRYSGQDDICVGVPVAGRQHETLDKAIGFFLNMLVLRTELSGDPTFRQLLARVRQRCLDDYTHQDVPFETVVEALKPQRAMNHHPLFQVSFALQPGGARVLRLAGLQVEELEIDHHVSRFDLELFVEERDGGFHGYISGAADLFDYSTVQRMARHYETLLQAIAGNPGQRISELAVLTSREKRQLLVEWNHTEQEYPKSKCIHQLFEEQVEKSPDSVALVFDNQQLTYRELNQRANQVAHYLQRLGVGPESLVAISMERSLEMIIGLLGILKAGGAYVPLDPQYPKQRLAFMLEDTQATVLLTQQRQVDDLYSGSKIEDIDNLSAIIDCRLKVICLDRDAEAIAGDSMENLSSEVSAENLAYVIYTSGSTGKPKGVAITHHNVARLFASTDAWFYFDRNDVWTLFHSYAFDFSVWEIWGALLHGGQLVIVSYWVSRSPELFYDLLCKRRVTVLNQTPAAFRQLMQAEERSVNQELALRLIIFGGEALDFQSLKPWFDRHGDQSPRLVNMYGITETTVHVTYRPIEALDLGGRLGSPIGVRIPDLEVYILDPNRNLAPIGVPGELHIGGAGLARGYINRPELTAEKFIAHPFSDERGARLYRTGDLARYLPDGNIEFLGRIDDQVKIRGYRIELGEIEAVLSRHPAVLEAVVVAREDAPDRRLVVYVVYRQGVDVSVNELRSFLKQKLPVYMIPSVFVVLEALPLMANGKVDRKALPAPDQSRPELEQGHQAPRTPMEEMLAEIWREVLKLQRIGIHDNFFDLGGHSLLATQVISRVRAAFQTNLALRTLFEMPTVAELANAIVTEQAAALDDDALAGILTGIEESSDAEAELETAEHNN